MTEKYSIPGAIVLAGAIIAGAVLISRSPARVAGTETDPSVSPSPKPIVVRDVDVSTDHIRGNADATITLIEYSDTECPYCKVFHETLKRITQEYDGKVRWVYRHFPLDNLHPKARKEAEATECAGEQGKFWEYLDRIFEVTPSNDGLDPAQLPVLAKDVGLDVPAFETCLSSGKYAERVDNDIKDATDAGGRGTPHTVILTPAGEKIPLSGAYPYESVKGSIESILENS